MPRRMMPRTGTWVIVAGVLLGVQAGCQSPARTFVAEPRSERAPAKRSPDHSQSLDSFPVSSAAPPAATSPPDKEKESAWTKLMGRFSKSKPAAMPPRIPLPRTDEPRGPAFAEETADDHESVFPEEPKEPARSELSDF